MNTDNSQLQTSILLTLVSSESMRNMRMLASELGRGGSELV